MANARIGLATFFRRYENLDDLLADLAKEQIDKMLYVVLPVMEEQDTLIESAASKTGKAHVIKSHHNVGGLPDDMAMDLV